MSVDQTSVPQWRPFDKSQFAFCMAGAIVGIMLTTVAGIKSATPGPLPPPGDETTTVTSTFEVFGLPIKESTGFWGSHDKRFGNFHTLVCLVFAMTGMIVALALNLAYRFRNDANVGNPEPPSTEGG